MSKSKNQSKEQPEVQPDKPIKKKSKYDVISHRDAMNNPDYSQPTHRVERRQLYTQVPYKEFDSVTNTNITKYKKQLIDTETELSEYRVSDFALANLLEIGAVSALQPCPALTGSPTSCIDNIETNLNNIINQENK